MPRGKRKSPLEKLQGELLNTQEAISKHKAEIRELKERENQIVEEIGLEEFKEISTILEEKKLSIEEVKEMLKI